MGRLRPMDELVAQRLEADVRTCRRVVRKRPRPVTALIVRNIENHPGGVRKHVAAIQPGVASETSEELGGVSEFPD